MMAVGALLDTPLAAHLDCDCGPMTPADGEARLGESVASVKSRPHRARMALREELTHHWSAA